MLSYAAFTMGRGVSNDGSPIAREKTFSPAACFFDARLNISNAGESGISSRSISTGGAGLRI